MSEMANMVNAFCQKLQILWSSDDLVQISPT